MLFIVIISWFQILFYFFNFWWDSIIILLLLQEEIQKLIDDHKATLEARKTEFEAEIEQRQSLCKEREEALRLFE